MSLKECHWATRKAAFDGILVSMSGNIFKTSIPWRLGPSKGVCFGINPTFLSSTEITENLSPYCHYFSVTNLRPNGEYEFRVSARTSEGILSEPSPSSGYVRIKPAVPMRSQHPYNPDLMPPGQPQVKQRVSGLGMGAFSADNYYKSYTRWGRRGLA